MASNLYFTTAGMKTLDEMPEGWLKDYYLHHVAKHAGYVPCNKRVRFGTLIEEYSGRFGEGYKVHVHSTVSTRFHRVGYYIKKGR